MSLATIVTVGDLLAYYEVGQPVTVSFTYTQAGLYVDPGSLPTVTVIDPTLGSTNPVAVKDAQGCYHVVTTPSKPGRHRVTVTSTAPVTETSVAFSVVPGASS